MPEPEPQPQPQPQPQQLPTNVVMLTMLYDSAALDLRNAIATKKVSLTDERIKSKVTWLGEVASALSNVYQVEAMRTKAALPAEQKVIDHALVEAQKNKLGHPGIGGQPPGHLGQFPSPGGWRP